MKTIKDYIQGEHFVYGKKNCIVLEHTDDGTLCMGRPPCEGVDRNMKGVE